MRFVALPTVVAVVVLGWAVRTLDPAGIGFAFVAVWVPMTWLGLVSRVFTPRLPERWHHICGFEADGRLHEHLGVRIAKRLLRRGPLAAFNPGLHLPAERTPANLARFEQRTRDAEASHVLLFLATLGVVTHAAVRGWWTAAVATLLFDVVMNGYPALLQRYNRVLLRRRVAGLALPAP